MELGEWIGGRIIENSDIRGSDNRGSTVLQIAHTEIMVISKLLLVAAESTEYHSME